MRAPHAAVDAGEAAPSGDDARLADGPAPAAVYVVGDVHLGGRHGGGDAFPGWLARLAMLPPARLVILGDLFEYWLETDAAARRHAAVLAQLRALGIAGWRIDLVAGNRELAAGRRLETAAGCRLHWPALDLRLGDRRVRVVHGDRLCHDPGYRFFSAWMRGFWTRIWTIGHPAWIQDLVARLLRRGSRGGRPRPPGRRRVFIDPRRVAAAGRHADLIIAGHVHASWRRRVRGVELLLVGDWPPGGGRWVEIAADGAIARRRLVATAAG